MPKLPVISGADAVKAFQRAGCPMIGNPSPTGNSMAATGVGMAAAHIPAVTARI